MTNVVRSVAHGFSEGVRSRLWPVPSLGIALALVLGILIPVADSRVDDSLAGWLDALVFGGDAGAAQTVLGAISSSVITVTALTFSLTVVTLQLASSQFSPRLLRTFTKDLFVQVTLALFLATFTFSLTVLRSVRSGGDGTEAFVPRMAVTVAFLLAVASVIGLVLFLAHLTRQIRVETMLANVHADASATIEASLAERDSHDADEPPAIPLPSPGAAPLMAEASGFLVSVDEASLVELAREHDACVRIDRMPGSFIVAGTPVATVWHVDGTLLTAEQRGTWQRAVCAAIRLGSERTGTQDVGFGLRQLTDVANKALSPGINDPTTAVHALGHVSALLAELAAHRLGPVTALDADGTVRAVFSRPTFAQHLESALAQPRLYGSADPLVGIRLLTLLRDLAWTIPAEHHSVLTRQLHRQQAVLAAQGFDVTERQLQHQLATEVLDALTERRA